MKTAHKVFVAGLCLCLISTQQSFSQNSVPFDVASVSLSNSGQGVGSAAPGASAESAVNSKAIQHFHQAYPAVNEVVWRTGADGSYAHFVANGMKVRMGYDRRGRWVSTIRTLQNDQVPADVVNMLNQGFPGYSIYFAQVLA